MHPSARTTLVGQDVLNDDLSCSLLRGHIPFCVSYEKGNKAPITQDLWVSIALDEIIIPPLWMQLKRSCAGRNPQRFVLIVSKNNFIINLIKIT